MAYQDESVLNILIDAMDERLNEVLVGESNDETKAGLVRPGNLQEDPTDAGINILIHEGGVDWQDELYVEQHGIDAPTYEIGGVEYWFRRFEIELELFFDGEDQREPPRRKALIIYSRAKKALTSMDIPTEKDSFGEQAHMIQVRKGYTSEGGGEGTFIWNCYLFVEFLTSIRANA